MYLPEQVIESLLREKGFAAEEVVVSSQIGLTKGSGSLFEYVLKNYGVAPRKNTALMTTMNGLSNLPKKEESAHTTSAKTSSLNASQRRPSLKE